MVSVSSLDQSSKKRTIQRGTSLQLVKRRCDHRKKLKILLLLLRNFFDGVGPEVEALDSFSFSSSLLIFLFSILRVMSAHGTVARNVVAVDA
jgi:hypothetical protein